MTFIFKNRQDAGIQLSQKLVSYKNSQVIVLALPRGGVVVGYEIAKMLRVSIYPIIVRKIGMPSNPEFAIGGVGEDGTVYLDENTINTYGVAKNQIEKIIQKERTEIQRRVWLYRKNTPLPPLRDKTVLLIDDGSATGISMRTALEVVINQKPEGVICVSPVCSSDSIRLLKPLAKEIICLLTLYDLRSISSYYFDFSQTTDEEVVSLLHKKTLSVPTR
ncbi:phosphoribosyltransferase [Candidatus Roizmanbacteria bacterium CG09_land_8_20_14_0_10_41_9]|uniref:Phosphoribosyltransferase n=1 Tax=Candidatus Roizmanbacteria bacterium CG09_land_8_20_14_0_10_41_9 TaxID=1974850 RepID=A0A2H0WS74_9BACT|nr:MAG: phosphoribosyltransferase [Candidatus Roizmanbacteria bacterium CG09_land_8_20_14_0_10_41_9]